MTMLDTAMALTAHSVLEAGEWCPTHGTSTCMVQRAKA